MRARASSPANELDRGNQSREGDSTWKILCSNSSGGTQTPKDSRHAKVRACTLGRGFRGPKHNQELWKSFTSEESRKRSGFPQLGSKPGEPVSLLCRLVLSSCQQPHNPGLWRSKLAHLAFPCILGKDAEVVFSCALRDRKGHQFILHSYSAPVRLASKGQEEGFGTVMMLMGQPPQVAPLLLCSISQASIGTITCHCHIPTARPWAPAPSGITAEIGCSLAQEGAVGNRQDLEMATASPGSSASLGLPRVPGHLLPSNGQSHHLAAAV